MDDVASIVISFLSGGIGGGIVAHLFAKSRDAENRALNFIGLMDGMRAEAERKIGNDYAEVFPTRLYEVRREGAKVRQDLDADTRMEFDEAITALCRLTNRDVSAVARDSDHHPGRIAVTARANVHRNATYTV